MKTRIYYAAPAVKGLGWVTNLNNITFCSAWITGLILAIPDQSTFQIAFPQTIGLSTIDSQITYFII